MASAMATSMRRRCDVSTSSRLRPWRPRGNRWTGVSGTGLGIAAVCPTRATTGPARVRRAARGGDRGADHVVVGRAPAQLHDAALAEGRGGRHPGVAVAGPVAPEGVHGPEHGTLAGRPSMPWRRAPVVR